MVACVFRRTDERNTVFYPTCLAERALASTVEGVERWKTSLTLALFKAVPW